MLKQLFHPISALVLPALLLTQNANGQETVLLHSHNDYHQQVPFYQAYAQGFDSYEADVFFDTVSGGLLVAHDATELQQAHTLNNLYIEPIASIFQRNKGKAWKNSDRRMYLLIDIKDNYEEVIPALLASLQIYPAVFNPGVNPLGPVVVLTGNIPAPGLFENYPPEICFDGRPHLDYTPQQLQRVAFISDSFTKYSGWNGKGSMQPSEKAAINKLIEQTHRKGKMIRFWGSPDNLTTWQTLRTLGIDIVNTDKPEACALFFRNEKKQNFQFRTNKHEPELIKTDKLDKTTREFRGFSSGKTLQAPVEVYHPSGLNDGSPTTPLNVILLIGDGMGLTQLSAADLVNGGLSMTQLKNCGLHRTTPHGSYIADSAGAGSALSTGVATPNRHIATDTAGLAQQSITEILLANHKTVGIVTNGSIADATPAAFYAHAVERDDSDLITSWLLKNKLNFVAGSGGKLLTNRTDGRNLLSELQHHYSYVSSVSVAIEKNKPVLLIDEQLGDETTESTIDLLATTTKKALQHLESEKGFFLLVEGAKIDYAGHANSLPNTIIETLGFDLAVGEALKFADKKGNTLVIVTGDHETGGLSIIDGDQKQRRITGVFSSDDHTPVFLPVFAYGPGSENFKGTYANTAIFNHILSALRL